MESLLEEQRHHLEERERLEKAYCDEGLADHKTVCFYFNYYLTFFSIKLN